MAELRWNPLLQTWTMVASNRQDRPQLPKKLVSFCPGSGKVPDSYDVHDNDFPALTNTPEELDFPQSGLYKNALNYGKCEVVYILPIITVLCLAYQ